MKIIQIPFLLSIIILLSFSCEENKIAYPEQYITILGEAQDAGFPHINNPKEWNDVRNGIKKRKLATSIGLIDQSTKQKWLFEATPDMPQQLHILENDHLKTDKIIDGIFLTHAHIGHYTGIMHFGREAMGSKNIPVYAMPKMKQFLENNGPWDQLVSLENIKLKKLKNDSLITLNNILKVTPFLVPHRDEYSETVGYKIEGKNKTALFIPDINKWHFWNKNIIEEVKNVDYAFIDATFFKEGEVPRPMSEIPHPFIEETVKLFENESVTTKSKIHFIHLNHSNPALNEAHFLKDSIQALGYHFASQNEIFGL
ncbi:MBL fold metallo-hydrolase [Flavobacteriaceae bacterium AU392]|nr:MBL fold metallo-hydrolase [Flavobacteriaceae bacterium]RKM81234.1 MBL fold metallo-hydrolase [Flavobacteriaceae bacterium AU392]